MGRVDVTDLEAGPLPGQTAGAESRQPPLVGESGQGVRLVHELGELGRPEELLDGGHHRTDVDQRLRRDGLDVLGRHALPDDPLHPGEADPDLVLDELTHRADAPVAEVVDVVVPVVGLAGVELHQVGDRGQDVGPRQGVVDLARTLEADALQGGGEGVELFLQLLVDLVAADLGQVVALGVEEQVLQQAAGRLHRGRLTRAQLAVDVEEGVVDRLGVVALEGVQDRLERLPVGIEQEVGQSLGVVPHAERLEQDGDGLLALAVDADVDGVLLVDLELQPGAPAGNHLGIDDVHLRRRLVRGDPEVDARRAHQLGHHDPLGAVDDEGALVGHHREVPHEDRLLLDLARGRVHEPGGDEEGTGEGHVLLLALLLGVLGRLELGVGQLQLQRSGEVLDGRDVGEGLGDALIEEPLERVTLHSHQIG